MERNPEDYALRYAPSTQVRVYAALSERARHRSRENTPAHALIASARELAARHARAEAPLSACRKTLNFGAHGIDVVEPASAARVEIGQPAGFAGA